MIVGAMTTPDALRGSLYEPHFEHDNCGIGMIVDIKGRPSHKLVTDAIEILTRLTHRGGVGFEPDTGDGAGILLQMPDAFMRRVAAQNGIKLACGKGSYGVAMLFASPDPKRLKVTLQRFEQCVNSEGLSVLGIRNVPVNPACIGATAALARPSILQVFIGNCSVSSLKTQIKTDAMSNTAINTEACNAKACNGEACANTDANSEANFTVQSEADIAAFERTLYIISKKAHNMIRAQEHDSDPYFYLASCSAKTLVYKGMLLPSQLPAFYLDLNDTELASAIALVHSRFSTNTFPSWERAHPMHHIIHNGEINTIRGNVNWVNARQSQMSSAVFGQRLQDVFPVINENGSDSAMLDDFLSLLLNAGFSLHEAMMMAIPEPWEENTEMHEDVRAFYEYNSCLMEPWDGPASVAFTDGRFAGATLDRNGLRPSRYYVTTDDQLILSSEVGVLPIPAKQVLRKERLRPGRMLLIDTVLGRIIEDEELKKAAASFRPYKDWLNKNMLHLSSLTDLTHSEFLCSNTTEANSDIANISCKNATGTTKATGTSGIKSNAATGEKCNERTGTTGKAATFSDLLLNAQQMRFSTALHHLKACQEDALAYYENLLDISYHASKSPAPENNHNASMSLTSNETRNNNMPHEASCAQNASIQYEQSKDNAKANTNADANTNANTNTLRNCTLLNLQKVFGYTWEDISLTLASITNKGDDPIASMGYDAPLAVLSDRPQLLYNYFKQLFAQVTNPPIDAIREHLVTSSIVHLGPKANILEPDESNCRVICHNTPILTADEFSALEHNGFEGLKCITLPMLFEPESNGGLGLALEHLFNLADLALEQGYGIIILSDRDVSNKCAPIPALLATAGLHHHMLRLGKRTQMSIVVASGEPREVHHHALLVGYGADAIYPYLSYECAAQLAKDRLIDVSEDVAKSNYRKAITNSIVKVMSKMGISTVRSYQGAQIFEALGICSEVIDRYFCGTTSRIGGITLNEIEAETLQRHTQAFSSDTSNAALDSGGDYRWRHDGEHHLLNPQSIFYLQQAARSGSYQMFKRFSSNINDRSHCYKNIRSLLDIITADKPIPLADVESVEKIVRRFKTGAMSFGSISTEAHECMAIAMNRLGGKSNSGEGGESPERYIIGSDGQNRCSSIKQVASGRFGVTINYLNNCTEIQIKIAQGAKPGEGGHLPGAKVYPWVAKNRFSTPGVELISPPPHHDIYSIEDLAQLIFDLKCANRDARVSVKLVSEAGVGTIAVGVAKGLADAIVVSGFDGGTGAASRTSIRHAGLPWELGVAETHQSLVANKLRDRVVIETDGKLFTGRDVVIAALLGAEEFTFATAPLIALGCDMMRVCNMDTCPVGIATQNPELRAKFQGKPEHVQNFMLFVAQEVREWMARIGVAKFDDLVGHVELLRQTSVDASRKAASVDLSRLLHQSRLEVNYNKWHFSNAQQHGLKQEFDLTTLVPLCYEAIHGKQQLEYSLQIQNRSRSLGTVLSSEITRVHGVNGLPDGSINLHLYGSGGQSFGAFLASGITLDLTGDSNDYLGKGMSGGRIIVRPPTESLFVGAENIVIGNVALYGATAGEVFLAGIAGERFGVRNSGAIAVVEGVGDHGCE
ncbi:MAG: glutamate synthase large subunit, partial [Coriobacteriales bacterium]|nr:glutamate synthase large subunit [Coriobacteriales bacterium]